MLLKSQSSQSKLSLSLKLWLSQYDWQKIGERENFSKGLVGILFLLSNLDKIISISLSRLESGEPFSKFLFLFSKLEKRISDFSFSSRNWRFVKKVLFLLSKLEKRKPHSLSLLESGEPFFKFLFLLSKLGKGISGFSFSSRNWRKEYQISLSLLDWTFWPLVNDWIKVPLVLAPELIIKSMFNRKSLQ